MREVVHSFALPALVEGRRFCHVRWLTDDPALATIMNMERVRGEDALPRLARGMSVEQMREWMQQPQTELYAALPERFIAEWDSGGQHPLRSSGRRGGGLQPAQAGVQKPSPADSAWPRARACACT